MRVEVREQRDLRTLAGRPQPGVEPVFLFGFLEEGEVVEADEAGLQIALAGAGLGGNDVRGDEIHQDPVDIGKLVAVGIDAVEIGIALEDEPRGRRRRDVDPGIERRQFRIFRAALALLAGVQRGPAIDLFLRDLCVKCCLVGIFGMELLHVVGRPVDIDRRGRRQRRQECRVRLRPGILDRQLVDDLEFRFLAIDHHLGRNAFAAQFGVLDHVLPEIAEVLGGEGMAVGPFVPLADVQREFLVVDDIDRLEEVGLHLDIRAIADQTRIFIDRDLAEIFLVFHQHAHVAAVFADLLALGGKVDDERFFGQALGEGRQLALLHELGKLRCFARKGIASRKRRHMRQPAGEPRSRESRKRTSSHLP